MIMHHKFCLIDTRELETDEVREREKILRKQSAKEEQLKKKGQKVPRVVPPENRVQLPKNGVLITGSCNWTMQGFSGNWENVIVTSNRILVDRFKQEYLRIYNDFVQSNAR